MTFSPMARGRTFSTKSLTTVSATSASISAARTSPSASSTSLSLSAPRPLSLSKTPPSRDCNASNIFFLAGFQPTGTAAFQEACRQDAGGPRGQDGQNTNAPGGAPALPEGDP